MPKQQQLENYLNIKVDWLHGYAEEASRNLKDSVLLKRQENELAKKGAK